MRRHKDAGQSFYFSDELIDWLGPRREGDVADEPYIDYAAAMQQLFEETCLALMQRYLGGLLAETGKLAFAGGGALNVKLNQRIVARDDVQELFVQPASGDSGTSLGAATWVAAERGDTLARMDHVYLGPAFNNDACLTALEARQEQPQWRQLDDVVNETANILAAGNPVAWFQGRMEFGPRALGGRSILGCPNAQGIADRINEQIKFRERWRPFCPSVLDEIAAEIIQTDHPAPFMTITFDVAQAWKSRIPEVVHEDGTARVQIVTAAAHPRYHALLKAMEARTGNAVLLNTSLNRRGEPVVCTPDDALNMFYGSDLEYLVLEDYLVTKRGKTRLMQEVDLLQVCPYDRAPFREICRSHAAAAELLGWSSHTVFLHSPDGRAQFSPEEEGRYYMDGPEDPAGLHHLRNLRPTRLCLFHRYRSLRVARRAGLKSEREILVAHEFGLLESRWRWLRLKLLERGVQLAGVSPPVADELSTPLVLPNALQPGEQDRQRVSREVARTHLGVAGECAGRWSSGSVA